MEQNENQDSIRERIRAYAFDLKLPLVRRDIVNPATIEITYR